MAVTAVATVVTLQARRLHTLLVVKVAVGAAVQGGVPKSRGGRQPVQVFGTQRNKFWRLVRSEKM